MFTRYFLDLIGEDIFKHQESQRVPHVYYMGFSSTIPEADGTNVTEPSPDAGYSRVAIYNDENTFDITDENNNVNNYDIIYFPESKAPWNGLMAYVVYDEPEGGNLLMYGRLSETIDVPIRTMISIPVAGLNLSVVDGG